MEIVFPESPHLRNVVAIVLGLTASTMTVGSVEIIAHRFSPELAQIDYEDQTQMQEVLSRVSVSALACIIAGWTLGILLGCLVAGVLGHLQGTFCCVVLSIIYVMLAITTLTQLPAPRWFTFTSLFMLFPGGLVGWWLSQVVIHRLQQQKTIDI